MADRQDATLMVQLASWGSTMGLEEAMQAVWADDFDAEAASPRDVLVSRLLNWGETIGTLTKNGLLDTDLVLDWLWVAGVWKRVEAAALKARDEAGELDVLVGRFLGRSGDDQRGPGLVDQDRIDLVDDGEVVLALDHVLQAEAHIVPEVVEAELVVGAVGDVGVVGLAARARPEPGEPDVG